MFGFEPNIANELAYWSCSYLKIPFKGKVFPSAEKNSNVSRNKVARKT